MIVESSSRWEMPEKKAILSLRVKITSILVGISAVVYLVSAAFLPGTDRLSTDHSEESGYIDGSLAEELRLSVSADDPQRVRDLVEAVSKLTLRVELLENERNRLTSEMNELAGDDGVLARIVTHVRSLHAKIEATRHDVVDAMMTPLPERQPAISDEGRETETSMEGEGSPFLTKAQHTIVTPVASASRVAEKVEASPKHKGKAAHAAPGEGDTN